MGPRFSKLLLGVLALGCAAFACSSAQLPQTTSPLGFRAIDRAPATATAYAYVVNFATNDVTQLAFNPRSRNPFHYVASPFALPSSCIGPDSLALSPSRTQLFVGCSSGEIVALGVNPTTHALSASPIAPVPVASPLSLMAPATGKRNMLYADGYNGQLLALTYTPSSLRLMHAYSTTPQYPDQMAMYTSPAGASTLFVAAPYDRARCRNVTAGDIVPWHQNADGSLTRRPAIPACSTAFHVLVVGSNLYWAAANYLGGYSLTRKKMLAMPKPRWAGSNHGPGTYPDAMSLALALPNASHANGPLPAFTTTNGDGTVTLYDAGGVTLSTMPLRADMALSLSTPVIASGMFALAVDRFVFSLTSDIIRTNGISPTGQIVGFPVTPVGLQPRGIVVVTSL